MDIILQTNFHFMKYLHQHLSVWKSFVKTNFCEKFHDLFFAKELLQLFSTRKKAYFAWNKLWLFCQKKQFWKTLWTSIL